VRLFDARSLVTSSPTRIASVGVPTPEEVQQHRHGGRVRVSSECCEKLLVHSSSAVCIHVHSVVDQDEVSIVGHKRAQAATEEQSCARAADATIKEGVAWIRPAVVELAHEHG
jgi:hypothetical protein